MSGTWRVPGALSGGTQSAFRVSGALGGLLHMPMCTAGVGLSCRHLEAHDLSLPWVPDAS
jgi:hypothetical protein